MESSVQVNLGIFSPNVQGFTLSCIEFHFSLYILFMVLCEVLMQFFATSFIFTNINSCNLLTNFRGRLCTDCSIRFLWDLTDDFPLVRK